VLYKACCNGAWRATNPAVQKVTQVAPTIKKVKYGGRVSLHYFLFLRMIETFLNVRGLGALQFVAAVQKILKTNFIASRVRETYKRGANAHHGSVCRIYWKGKCITGLSSFCKSANTLTTTGVVRNTTSLNIAVSGSALILLPYSII
jgi:hypothetical protein